MLSFYGDIGYYNVFTGILDILKFEWVHQKISLFIVSIDPALHKVKIALLLSLPPIWDAALRIQFNPPFLTTPQPNKKYSFQYPNLKEQIYHLNKKAYIKQEKKNANVHFSQNEILMKTII